MMQFTVDPVWSWPTLLVTALGLTAFVVWTYRIQSRALTPTRGRLLLGLKLLAVVLLLLAALRPAVQFSEQDDNTVQLLIVSDVSRSMNTPDGSGGATRWVSAQQDLQRLSSRWKSLGDKITVRMLEFDRELRPARPELAAADGELTALGSALDNLGREVRQQRTLGILLLSDGAQRALPPDDIDPLVAARKLATEQAPVYTVGYGATALSSTTMDLALTDLLVDPVVFERKLVPLKVQLKSLGAARQKARVRVLVEDRRGKTIGQSGEMIAASATQNAKVMTEVEIRGNDDTRTLDLSFVPQQPGELKIAVEVESLDGEVIQKNNRVETIITVRQGGLRVAYFDTARPEQYFLRMVNGSEKIQLDWFEIRRGRFRQRTRIDPAVFERGAYDVYILGDVPAEIFGPPLLNQLVQRLQDGAGLMMLGGLENFSAGGYSETPLADYLPVLLLTRASGGGVDLAAQLNGPQLVVPTATGMKRYVMQLASADRNRQVWAELAPLVGATKLQPKPGIVEVWAESVDGTPLLCAAEVGRARVVAFGGDTTYQWVMHGQADQHQRFWRQMILWLARKEADNNQAIWARVEPRNLLPGARAAIEVGARDETGQPIADADFAVEVTRPDGQKETVSVRATADGGIAEFPTTQAAGDYWVRVSARKGGTSLGVDGATRFIVDPRDLELDQPNADYETLRQIAQLTGGELLKGEDLPGFVDRLSELKLQDLTRVTTRSLWDNFWFMIAFVGVLTVEWSLRKRWGLA